MSTRKKTPRPVRALRLIEGKGTCSVPATLLRIDPGNRPVIRYEDGVEVRTFWDYVGEVSE